MTIPHSNRRFLFLRSALVLGIATGMIYLALHLKRSRQVESLPLTPAATPARKVSKTPPLSIIVRTAPTLAPGADPLAIAESMAKAGVRSVWLQFKQDESDEVTGGMAFYPSAIAPVAPGFAVDRLGPFIDALSARGIEVRAWMPTLHDPAAAQAHPDWRAQKLDDQDRPQPQPDWLCPNEPRVAEYEGAIAAEIVGRYPKLQSLYVDFIRYDSDFSCVCPRCLGAISKIAKSQVTGPELRAALKGESPLWQQWTDFRAKRICDVVHRIHDRIDPVRPKFTLGAFVLPFSAADYYFNTQSGQDLWEMARARLNDIVLMGYWDDWRKVPEWVKECYDSAIDLVKGQCDLHVVLDGDMSVRRTRRTLEATGEIGLNAGYFLYNPWTAADFARVQKARTAYATEGLMPPPKEISVVIRIDTEPDDAGRYDTVSPEMIDKLVEMFGEEDVKATFITCGKLAELQPDAVRRAAQAGHEIGCHAYNHEQLDDLEDSEQVKVVARGLQALQTVLGKPVVGFGAPRNSITSKVLDYLIDQKLEYDGSAAFDPMDSFVDVDYVSHTLDPQRHIVVVPFIVPNDYDARIEAGKSAANMLEEWKVRLDRVIERREPCFVLDIHQWSASQPANLESVRQFIRYAKTKERCRLVTLREAARNAREVIDHYELPNDSAPPGPALPTTAQLSPQ
jgi:peptidoglycan/xylan/chitin deacetylase (PgdA/CDA1 family)